MKLTLSADKNRTLLQEYEKRQNTEIEKFRLIAKKYLEYKLTLMEIEYTDCTLVSISPDKTEATHLIAEFEVDGVRIKVIKDMRLYEPEETLFHIWRCPTCGKEFELEFSSGISLLTDRVQYSHDEHPSDYYELGGEANGVEE